MSKLPVTMELDSIGIDRLKADRSVKDWLRKLCDRHEEIYKLLRDRIEKLNQQNHIADADGTLADITTKFNSLLGKLENQDLLNSS